MLPSFSSPPQLQASREISETLGAGGVPLEERHARLEEGSEILRRALAQETVSHAGRFWNIPEVALRPRPYRGRAPLFLRASSSLESLHQAAAEGVPLMFGLVPIEQIAERIAAYRARRSALGRSASQIDREVAEFRVLRRIVLAATDGEALAYSRRALRWETTTARRVHGAGTDAGARLANIDKFVNGEPVENQDVVIWYGAHFTHDVKSEPPGEFGHIVGPELKPVNW
ncbi:MAG TPA: LLM class flavin-dependent oxidoreductase [Thermoanaerobaculia bacterium]|nr:LLM class flavin-dependent oxidoreductase [Thermoanaerobaculia bacterium]